MPPSELRAMADRLEAEAAKLRKIAEQMDNPVQAGIDEVLKQLAELNRKEESTQVALRRPPGWYSPGSGIGPHEWLGSPYNSGHPFGDCNGEKS